ncbi:MAG: hypothetical protein ACREAW_10270, partial [Nitrososphaera sp.]
MGLEDCPDGPLYHMLRTCNCPRSKKAPVENIKIRETETHHIDAVETFFKVDIPKYEPPKIEFNYLRMTDIPSPIGSNMAIGNDGFFRDHEGIQ